MKQIRESLLKRKAELQEKQRIAADLTRDNSAGMDVHRPIRAGGMHMDEGSNQTQMLLDGDVVAEQHAVLASFEGLNVAFLKSNNNDEQEDNRIKLLIHILLHMILQLLRKISGHLGPLICFFAADAPRQWGGQRRRITDCFSPSNSSSDSEQHEGVAVAGSSRTRVRFD